MVTEPYLCGHAQRVRGCGGCDPGAVELQVLDDGTVIRDDDPRWHDLGGWTSEDVAAEEQRRAAERAAGRCPDSGLALHACHRSVCDCFDAERCPSCATP